MSDASKLLSAEYIDSNTLQPYADKTGLQHPPFMYQGEAPAQVVESAYLPQSSTDESHVCFPDYVPLNATGSTDLTTTTASYPYAMPQMMVATPKDATVLPADAIQQDADDHVDHTQAEDLILHSLFDNPDHQHHQQQQQQQQPLSPQQPLFCDMVSSMSLASMPLFNQTAPMCGPDPAACASNTNVAMSTWALCTSSAPVPTQLTLGFPLQQQQEQQLQPQQHQQQLAFPCTPMSPNVSLPSPSSSLASLPLMPSSHSPHPALCEAMTHAPLLPNACSNDVLQSTQEAYQQSSSSGHQQSSPQVHHVMTPSSSATTTSVASVVDTTAQEPNSPETENSEGQLNTLWDPQPSQETQNIAMLSSSELRRQIHIQSEQKRRAQIKDGFEDLRNELPSCLNKKMSKVALLHQTVQHIQHLKNSKMTILAELERLVNENEQLKKFQEGVLQKQALEKMYHINSL